VTFFRASELLADAGAQPGGGRRAKNPLAAGPAWNGRSVRDGGAPPVRSWSKNYVYVARRFERSLRNDHLEVLMRINNLTFNHYQVVAALPDEAASAGGQRMKSEA
jgi:hypothetical protein